MDSSSEIMETSNIMKKLILKISSNNDKNILVNPEFYIQRKYP